MANKYTEAQKRAAERYRKNNAQIKITVPKHKKEKWQQYASYKGISLTKLITLLLDKITGE